MLSRDEFQQAHCINIDFHFFLGYWPFGLIVCDIWQVCDVMMCTSSIMHMCSISLDRYIVIRRPLLVRNKSRTVVGIKIAIGTFFLLTSHTKEKWWIQTIDLECILLPSESNFHSFPSMFDKTSPYQRKIVVYTYYFGNFGSVAVSRYKAGIIVTIVVILFYK